MRALFLDDERNPENVTWLTYPEGINWVVVRTYDEFIQALTNSCAPFDLISFDHDIQDFDANGVERTGYTCLKWLTEHCLDTNTQPPQRYAVHSKNIQGASNIQGHYENLLKYFSDG